MKTAHGLVHLGVREIGRRRFRAESSGAGARHEFRRASKRRNAAVRLHVLYRDGDDRRIDHRRHRPAVLARLGARAACAAARRRDPASGRQRDPRAATDRARPARADPRPGTPVSPARWQPATLDPGPAAGDAARRTARPRHHRRQQSRAVHPRTYAAGHPGAEPGQRPGHRARTGDARLFRHLDRARQRFRRPRDRRCERSRRRAAGEARLPAAPGVAQRGRGEGLLQRICQRGDLAPVPQRARASHLPVERLRALSHRQCALRRRGGRRVPHRRSDRSGAGLPFRAVAANDPRPPAQGDGHHVLAHPLAEPGVLRHLPVATRAARWPPRQQHPGLPHPVPLQQLPRHRRSRARGAGRSGGILGHAAGPVHAGPSLSDLDRVAAGIAGAHRRCRGLPEGGARAAGPAAQASPGRGHRPARLHQGHHRALQRRRPAARNSSRAGSASSPSSRSPRRRAA